MIVEHGYSCPYCGEWNDSTLDLSGGDQDYIEDCRVCCRPIECRLRVISDEGYSLETRRDNE